MEFSLNPSIFLEFVEKGCEIDVEISYNKKNKAGFSLLLSGLSPEDLSRQKISISNFYNIPGEVVNPVWCKERFLCKR
jgi:hypothetical protein